MARWFLVLLSIAGCSDKRIPDGLVPPPRPAFASSEAPPKDIAKHVARAAGAEAAGDRAAADESWAWVVALAPHDPLLVGKYARYLARTGRATRALAALDAAPPSPVGEFARGEALLALGRADEAAAPLTSAAEAGTWEAWDALVAASTPDAAREILTRGWTGTPSSATEALTRGRRRAALGLDPTDDLLTGVLAAAATPDDGLALVHAGSSACRTREVRAVAARADWSRRAEWAPAVAALDAASPCTAATDYAPRPGGP